MKERKILCIVCPSGCSLRVYQEDGQYKVEGNQCPRGAKYGIDEAICPTRILTSTIKIGGAVLHRLPVRTDQPIPKDKLFECMEILQSFEVKAPIEMGQILIENIGGTQVNLIASRSMEEQRLPHV